MLWGKIRERFLFVIGRIAGWLTALKKRPNSKPSPRLGAIDNARTQLLSARNCFENVTDPELVEIAIYSLKTAQLKYEYLLRRAKEDSIDAPFIMRVVTKPN